MTGLDRLRGYARRMDELHVWPGGAKLREIADQVEREARRDHDGDVSASAYDLLPEDERDAVAFVRKCGGVEFLKLHMSNLRDFMLDVMDRLGLDKGDSDAPEIVFDVLDSRLMPEGMEWPRYEDGEPVRFGSDAADVFGTSLDEPVISIELFENGFTLHGDGVQAFYGYEERVKRPAVLAADGEPLEVGQTVWHVSNGIEFTVVGLPKSGEYQAVKLRLDDEAFTGLDPVQLTHQRPVFDADGVPIREGDTVYDISDGTELVITSTELDKLDHVKASQEKPTKASVSIHPLRLTHTKPEPPDTWRRIEEDALSFVEDNAGIPHDQDQMERDMLAILRRCRALAERERGE